PLAPAPPGYPEYAAQQAQALTTAALDRLWCYWSRQLADLPPLELPFDHPRPARPRYAGASYAFAIEADLLRGLDAEARAATTTRFCALLSGFQALLSRYSGQRDFALGTPGASRQDARFRNTVGYFVNPLVLRAD